MENRRLKGVIAEYKKQVERKRQELEIPESQVINTSKRKFVEVKFDGTAIPGKRKDENEKNGDINITMTYAEKWGLYVNIVTNVTYKCQRDRRMGHPLPIDGGWNICLDVGIKPNACIVYSFGISNDWSFDDDMAEYGCSVYSFDPFNGYKEHKRSEHNWFYDIGLCDTDDDHVVHKYHNGNRTIKCRTLRSIKKMLHHQQKTIDVYKMDIEGDELKVLPQLLESGILSDIKQLDLEIHPYTKDILTVYNMFKTLQQDFGFELWSVNENSFSSLIDYSPYAGAHRRLLELAWVNTNFLNTAYLGPF
ncbi:probable methyltransferase-like protein 24 isoform X2 [Ptychodera flava]